MSEMKTGRKPRLEVRCSVFLALAAGTRRAVNLFYCAVMLAGTAEAASFTSSQSGNWTNATT
jgi:hypothetical protein